MGLNIQGVAVSKKDINDISKRLLFNSLQKIEKVLFEKVLSNSIGEDEIYVIETKNGTLLIFGDNIPLWEIEKQQNSDVHFWKIPMTLLSKNKNRALRFMIGETSNIFAFHYYEDGECLRKFYSVNFEIEDEEGKALDIEFQNLPHDEIIYELMLKICGDNIETIDLEQFATVYKYSGMNHISEIIQKPDIQHKTWYLYYGKIKNNLKKLFKK